MSRRRRGGLRSATSPATAVSRRQQSQATPRPFVLDIDRQHTVFSLVLKPYHVLSQYQLPWPGGVLRGALGRLNGPFILKMNVPVNLPIWNTTQRKPYCTEPNLQLEFGLRVTSYVSAGIAVSRYTVRGEP